MLANSDLYENLKDFLMATVKSLVSAIDAKDPYTSGHSERVNILSMLLGKTMGLSKEELDILRWASILHDVGKIGMPEAILKKPGPLTPEEYEIVKEHPERGYRVISPIRQLGAASLGVRCHHERADGNGYPLGIRGTEIPLPARIIAVADTYDALTSTRPYRDPRNPDQAFSVITSVRGTQLDSSIVAILEELMPYPLTAMTATVITRIGLAKRRLFAPTASTMRPRRPASPASRLLESSASKRFSGRAAM